MADFVLVHGAWHGAWCWRRVVQALTAAGHRAHALSLTGLGDRAHLRTPELSLRTHVQDVLALLEAQELQGAVLAVHSYAGMVGTAVADQAGERLQHLVYVDAVLPQPGESWSSTHSEQTRQARLAQAQRSSDHSITPPDPAIFGLAGDDHAWVQRRQVPHPAATYTEVLDFDPARVARVPRSYVSCTQPVLATIDISRQRAADPEFWGGLWQAGGGVRVHSLATGHDPMISAPQALTELLLQTVAKETS